MVVRDILLERDIAFEEVSSFPFILFNDIKSHPKKRGIIKRRKHSKRQGRKIVNIIEIKC